MNKMIILSSPSGAGKTTIMKHLMKCNLNLRFSVSACSRSKREGEIDGKDYYFLSVDGFKQKLENNDFVEWEEVYDGLFYGTLKSELERIFRIEQNVIFDVDVLGALNIKKEYTDQAMSIFVMPPSTEALKERLTKRGTESSNSIEERLERAEEEMLKAEQFDEVVVNDDLAEACHKAEGLVRSFLN